jgi:tetratricopeptide (TPR) repeat protein
LYPAHALLGSAYLDKARETYDPEFLAKARLALERSIAIQPNFEAYKTMARVCNFSHRFEDALRWGKLAAEAWPNDTGVTALMVEANLALGHTEEAKKLLTPLDNPPADFHSAAARGHWLVSQRRYDEAVDLFLEAAKRAQAQDAVDQAVWAKTSAAGVLIDSGKFKQARPLLESASTLDSSNRFFRIHEAELLESEGRLDRALNTYEKLLDEQDDPEIQRRAFVLAAKLGQPSRAELHFKSAEKTFRRAFEMGEVFTLETLARLYCDANVKLDQARTFAQRNLKYKRDQAALATLERVLSKIP